jgi:hypothetical protein
MPKSYFVGGEQKGLQNNVKPFWLHNQAYEILTNCLAWRERVRKKPGWRTLGRLQRNLTGQSLGNTSGGGLLSGSLISLATLEANSDIVLGSVQITISNQYFVDNSAGTFNVGKTITGASQANPCQITSNGHGLSNGNIIRITGVVGMTQLNNQNYTVTVTGVNTFTIGVDSTGYTPYSSGGGWVAITPSVTTGSINYATTAISIQTNPVLAATAATAALGYYPSLPALGITIREITDINNEDGVFFDSTYSYNFLNNQFQELPSNTPTTWTNPTTSNLFWFTNYYATVPQAQALWVTNNVDNIRYYDTASSPATWTAFTPALTSGGGTNLNACLLITPFKGRLLAFNTLEGATRFRQRLRYSQSTLIGAPTATAAWYSDVPGRGGFVDAPTSEAIVSLKNLKDRLIVYFENSTWEVVYTGYETLPFVWRQLNQELGSESTFSTVPFDNGILGVGNVGIHTCNGVNVVRFDDEIPDEVFKINNLDEGNERVTAVRDYELETVYWSYPDSGQFETGISGLKYPNKIFQFNYRNSTWSEFIESFTIFGYFQPTSDFTWDTIPYDTWDAWDEVWDSGLPNARNPLVCAGNQQGFIFTFDRENSCATDYSRKISSITGSTVVSPNHNFNSGDYIIFNYSDILGVTFNQTSESFLITSITDKDTFTFDGSVTGTYLGNGLIQKLDNFYIATKEFNPFMSEGQSVRFSSVDFLVDSEDDSGFEAKFYLNDSQSVYNSALTGSNEIDLGPSPLVPIQADQDTIWKRKNINAIGQFIQIEMNHSDDQMRNPNISQQQFVLHAMNIRLDPSGRINPS